MNKTDQARTPRFDFRGDAFSRDEEDALDNRRRQNRLDSRAPLIGLALSGGGVRSATFCIGLLQALAKNRVLHRFDYLSTVSGGGYAGSAFGRLFSTKVTPQQVEAGLADDNSLLLWWLRKNGRYLLPAGMHDVVQAWAGQLRGFVATQFEVTVLCLLVSCVIVLPHLVGYSTDLNWFGYGTDNSPAPLFMQTLWWVLVPLAVWAAVFTAFAYWWSSDPNDRSIRNEVLICILALALAFYLLSPIWMAPASARINAIMTVIGAVLLAAPLSRILLVMHKADAEKDRVRYTRWLAASLKVILLLLVLGASDLVSWFLADRVATATAHGTILTSAGLTAVLVAVARFVLPLLQVRSGKNTMVQLPLALIANLSGLLLVVVLALFWLCAVQYFIFLARLSSIDAHMHWLTVLAPDFASRPISHATMRLLIVAAPCLFYALLTGSNMQLINRSSLHAFYRSRIARTYVSLGNSTDATNTKPGTERRFHSSPLKAGKAEDMEKLTEVLDGDDIPLPEYAPHKSGGPIHLINCCINQTIDDRTGSYNADRKGVYLTVSSLGVETGTHLRQTKEGIDPLKRTTVAEWIAISGAAAGSGMGSMTRSGIAALFFLSGLRLGYWWPNGLSPKKMSWTLFGKSRAAVQEMLARFPGLQSPVWYLSDGGHFDNTGVYSLLKRKLKLIVLADCGADPHYVFADLENLIRKARIDMDTMIEFIDPVSLPRGMEKQLRRRFGTPDGITPAPGDAHLLLARITYPSGATGCLLVVKPRLCDSLPLDVAGYADSHLDFPQQSTANQFFDETQWESYCRLGDVLGQVVDEGLLQVLPEIAVTGRAVRANSMNSKLGDALAADGGAAGMAAGKSGAQTRRQRIAATLGASVSIGVLATLGVGGWQAWSSFTSQTHANDLKDRQQSTTDRVQTALESGEAYDAKMHARVYDLLQKYDDGQNSEGATRAIHQLGRTLNRSCGHLDRDSALFDRCMEDDLALRRARPAASPWHSALNDYASGTPKYTVVLPIADGLPRVIRITMQTACNAGNLAKPQHITLFSLDAPPANSPDLQRQFDAFGLIRQPVRGDSHGDYVAAETTVGWSKPVVLYSTGSQQAQDCARSLAHWLVTQKEFADTSPRALPVPTPLYGDDNAIELWTP